MDTYFFPLHKYLTLLLLLFFLCPYLTLTLGTLNNAVSYYLQNLLLRWLPKFCGKSLPHGIAVLPKIVAGSPQQETIISQWSPANLKKRHSATFRLEEVMQPRLPTNLLQGLVVFIVPIGIFPCTSQVAPRQEGIKFFCQTFQCVLGGHRTKKLN